MSTMLSRVESGIKVRPPRVVVMGRGGAGKTTFGASARNPLILPCEDGFAAVSAPRLPVPQDYNEILATIQELIVEKHDYGTLVIDTVDAMERHVHAETCTRHSDGKVTHDHIEGFGYGRGYTFADGVWIEFFQALDMLRSKRNMTILALCHAEIVTVKDPMIGPYDRISPKMHKRATALLREWCDVMGFLEIRRYAVTLGEEKGRNIKTATSSGERILHLEDRGGFDAKSRYALPPEIIIPEKEGFGALRNEIIKSMKETD